MTTILHPAALPANEWACRAAAVETALDEWRADEDEVVDLQAILAEAGYLYCLNEHDADMCMELINTPMRAPSYQHAALCILTDEAVREAGIGWDGQRIDHRNIGWLREGCWCWGAPDPNPKCPQHFPHKDPW